MFASLLPLLLQGGSQAYQLPAVGTAAAYEVRTYTSKHHAPGTDMWFSHGDGRLPGFRLLRLPDRRARPLFEIGSGFSHYSRYSDESSDRSRMSMSERRVYAHLDLEGSLDFHRPTATLELGQPGWIVTEHPLAAAYQRCAIRTARASAQQVEAQAQDPNERKQWRRRGNRYPLGHDQWNGFEFRGPRTLLALMSLPTPPFSDGPYLESARRRPRNELQAQEWDPFSWQDRTILAHGREFRSEIEVAGSNPASRLCRTLKPETLRARVSDTCSLGGVIDTRDGWPIVIGFSRTWKDAPGVSSSAGMLFHRLPPKPGFVPPPNPCAAVYRGNAAPAPAQAKR